MSPRRRREGNAGSDSQGWKVRSRRWGRIPMAPDTIAESDPIARQKSALTDHPNQATNLRRRVLVSRRGSHSIEPRTLDYSDTLSAKSPQPVNRLPSDDTRDSRVS